MAKSKEEYKLPKYIRFTDQLLPVIFNLAAKGYSDIDLGLTLGHTGDVEKWMRQLKAQHPDVVDAIKAGGTCANVAMIARAFEIGMGLFSQQQVTRKYSYKDGKRELVDEKTVEKPVAPDGTLLYKMLCSRLPEYFNNTQNLSIDNRSITLNADFNQEVATLAGNLIEAVKKKQVKSKEIEETDNDRNDSDTETESVASSE